MSIKTTTGDIFKSVDDLVVCPVNCVGVMGAGLALQFSKVFPAIEQDYREWCDDKTLRPGKIAVWKGCVVLFPTKNHWKFKSKMEWIESGLVDLSQFLEGSGCSISIPPLGCGLGGLDPQQVFTVIHDQLAWLPNKVTLYNFPDTCEY